MKKRFFSVLLAVVMLVCFVTALGISSSAYSTGTIDGTTIKWAFDDSRELLTISGEGDMPDYNSDTYDDSPWYTYKNNIKTVVIKESVSSVGNYAFFGYTAITRVDIGSAVKNIGGNAFSGCDAIETLVLSENAVTIESGAFDDYASIANLINWTFDASTGALTISGKGDMPEYGLYTYQNAPWYAYKDQITAVVVGDAVASVSAYSFYGYKSITKVQIGSSVKTVGDNSFSGCSALETLVLSEGIETIESHAFYSCAKIKKLTVPASATDISDSAFYSCKIEEVVFAEGTKVITCKSTASSSAGPFASHSLKKITLPSTVETIERHAFWGSSNLDSVTIPNSVKYIGDGAFHSGGNYAGVDSITFEAGGSDPLVIESNAFYNNTLKSLVLPERLTKIGDAAFYGTTGNELTSVHIPKNVSSISLNAFTAFSSKFTSITVDEENTTYKAIDGILYDKTGKTLVMCPKGRTTNVVLSAGVETIGASAFNGCEGVKSVTLPEGLTTIEANAFLNSGITQIKIPQSVATIDTSAFAYKKFNSITVENGNANYKSVNGILYSNDGKTLIFCPRGKTGAVTVIDGVETIADKAFYSCTGITSFALPDGLKTIGAYAFYECNKITEMVIPQSVESIGSNAFSGSWDYRFYNFASIIIPEGVQMAGTTFGSYVFEYNNSNYVTPHVTVTNGTHSIELTGSDIQYVTKKDIETAPTVSSLLQNSNITNPITVTETYNGVTYKYTVEKNQLTIDQGNNLVPANGYCKVIFDDGSDSLSSFVVEKGKTVTNPGAPTKNGLTFGGWYKESTCINEWNFDTDTVTADTTIYAKWTFSVSNITVTGSLEKPYDGEQITLTAENKSGATYQWYKDTEAIPGETNRILALDGKIGDNGIYYCAINLDGVTANTNTVTVAISKAQVEIFVEEMSLPLSMVDNAVASLIETLKTAPVPYASVSGYGVTVNYNKTSGGVDGELESFIQAGALVVQLGTEQVNGDVTTYPVILSCADGDVAYNALKTHYDVTFSSNGKFVIKPEAVIEWSDSVVQNNGIILEYTGLAITPSDGLFNATDGKTPANILTGGTKGYEFYYMITVEDILSGQRNYQYEYMLQNFLTSYTVGDYAEYTDDINNPNIYMSKYLEYLVEAELKTLDSEFVSLEHNAGARIVFNYYVKATYSGNDTYFGTESEYVLLTVKPIPLTVKAKDQTIFTNGAIVADGTAIVLEGAILADDGFRQTLESALPDLVDLGIITIEVNADTSVAGEYANAIVVKYNTEKLTELSGEDAVTASMFDITTVNGSLTVVDVSDVNSTIKALKDKIQELENAIGNLGTNNDIASQINDLADKIAAAQNAINALDDKYVTDAELAAVKSELEGKITAAQTALQEKIDALTDKVTDLATQLNTANGNITTNTSNVAELKTAVDTLKTWQAEAQAAIDALESLSATKEALKAAVDSLKAELKVADDNIAAAIKRIEALEGRVDSLEEAKKNLEDDITALQTAVAAKAEAQALTDAINSLTASIADAKAYAESQDAALKTLLEAADATINTAINELKTKVSDLEAGLTAANGKIDLKAEKTDVAALKTNVAELKTWQAEAQAAIDALESLSATKEEIKSAVDSLKAELKVADDNIAAAIKRIEALEGRVDNLEKEKEVLDKAVADLGAAMTSTTEALAKEIKETVAALEAAKKAANDGDAELKKAIETAEAALNTAIGELDNRVTVIESVLTTANANINTNTTDIATLKANIKTIEMLQAEAEKTIKALGTLIGTNESNITELQTSVTKLQESVYAADAKIAAAEARIAVLEGKVEELEGVKNELQSSVANLQAALATKADRVTVNNAISALQASITALQMAQNNYIFADMTLKNELTAAIDAAKELAISAATELVSESATELQAAIDKKADSATLEAKAGELAEAITLAEATSKAYADAQDAILKEAVEAELRVANELIASLGLRMTYAEAAIDTLATAVDALEKAAADDAQALKDAVEALEQALAAAKALAAEADTALETALNLMITEAQKALEAKISSVQSKLDKAIKDLKAADASNADELKKAIKAIEESMAAAESASAAADSALESKLTEAQNELTRKIAEVQANLDIAKDELNKALESGDTALDAKIKALNEALEAAKAASAASDDTLQTELTAKIDEADAAIYALIEKIQKELQQANAELNTAMEEGDDELNTQFIISISIAGVGVAGDIALLAWILISKKKKLF